MLLKHLNKYATNTVNGKHICPIYVWKRKQSITRYLTTIKTQIIHNQHTGVIFGNRASYAHALSPVERVLCHLIRDQERL